MFLLSLLGGLAIVAACVAAFVAATWHVAARFGTRWLPAAWLVGTVAFWLIAFLRLRAGGMPVHVPPQSPGDEVALLGFGTMGPVSAGLVTLTVRRRLRRSADGRLTLRSAAAGVGAFFAGMLIGFLVVAVNDLWIVAARMFP